MQKNPSYKYNNDAYGLISNESTNRKKHCQSYDTNDILPKICTEKREKIENARTQEHQTRFHKQMQWKEYFFCFVKNERWKLIENIQSQLYRYIEILRMNYKEFQKKRRQLQDLQSKFINHKIYDYLQRQKPQVMRMILNKIEKQSQGSKKSTNELIRSLGLQEVQQPSNKLKNIHNIRIEEENIRQPQKLILQEEENFLLTTSTKHVTFRPNNSAILVQLKNVGGNDFNHKPIMYRIKTNKIDFLNASPCSGYISGLVGQNRVNVLIQCRNPNTEFSGKLQIVYFSNEKITQQLVRKNKQHVDYIEFKELYQSLKQGNTKDMKSIIIKVENKIVDPAENSFRGLFSWWGKRLVGMWIS